jgi:hypothetical protein
MGKITRFALTLGLTMAAGVSAGLAHAAPDDDEAAASSTSSTARTDQSSADQTPEEKLAKRRERLQQGATRLRERAAEMRKKAAAGETPKQSPNAKRPPRTFEEQAQRLEEQAIKMEDRAKNLTAADVASPPGGDRAGASRKKRHQVRRIQLNRRWGDTLKDPDAISELKLHAERAAKLKRIRTLALKKSKDDPVAERASKLLGQEVARHELRMKELQAKSVAASVGSAPAATPGAAAPAEGATPSKTSATAPAGEETK